MYINHLLEENAVLKSRKLVDACASLFDPSDPLHRETLKMQQEEGREDRESITSGKEEGEEIERIMHEAGELLREAVLVESRPRIIDLKACSETERKWVPRAHDARFELVARQMERDALSRRMSELLDKLNSAKPEPADNLQLAKVKFPMSKGGKQHVIVSDYRELCMVHSLFTPLSC
jgi:hypothetical protein